MIHEALIDVGATAIGENFETKLREVGMHIKVCRARRYN